MILQLLFALCTLVLIMALTRNISGFSGASVMIQGFFVQLLLLNVSNNKLKSLPESIGSCFSLEELQADGNSIEEIPSTFCTLVNLKSLSLNNNKVNQISDLFYPRFDPPPPANRPIQGLFLSVLVFRCRSIPF
ncbi:hypothetical protein MLD38_026185 [Melastoma candidum]|uniref:Uncharacterized protein n=1 Tax=Melastoma candidum TaxID=119954 RepID=A0ACB9P0M5_9MYRT|nr:hypothetical protein MLD38_026185 [Melastoma candidum]